MINNKNNMEVSGMKALTTSGALLGLVLAVVLAIPAWAMGTGPKEGQGEGRALASGRQAASGTIAESAVAAPALSTTGSGMVEAKARPPMPGWETRGRMRIERSKHGRVMTVEYRDEKGKLAKTIKEHIDNRSLAKWRSLQFDPRGSNLIVEETPAERTDTRRLVVRYIDSVGSEVWSRDICCWENQDQVLFSSDGSVVAITDVGAGGPCEVGEYGRKAPITCVGLRILRASDGHELYRVIHGSKPLLSSQGKFVVYTAPEGYFLLDVVRKAVESISKPPCGDPTWVEDDGLVYINCWPACPICRVYVPGKGLMTVGEHQKK